ncbi:hypothetical protein [Neoaquamicrobium sediminum]|uniref:hypothetical protein n=1 Tax=Neoaquamicrobium sediminum TaxID=1849104 RepID=UPI003BA9AA6D
MSGELLNQIASDLASHGLILRGGFSFEADEERAAGLSGAPARSVLLVGNAGAGYWRHFSLWRETQPVNLPNPLDTWSRLVIGEVADHVGAGLIMPNDRPFQPFQQWAIRAEGLAPSPLGLLMHPVYGLWHAYRGALLLGRELAFPSLEKLIHPCDLCDGKPCLNACPVGAFSAAGFDYPGCVAHVRGRTGQPCRGTGCLARNACPIGAEWRYPAAVQAFHQAAFAGL